MMKRMTVAVITVALALTATAFAERRNGPHATSTEAPRVFLLNGARLQTLRSHIASLNVSEPALEGLRRDAEEALKLSPASVMQKSAVPPSGDRHDYMSLAPYWWRNPDTADGLPYVRRDGERNPESAQVPDHRNFGRLTTSTHDLALAYYLFGNEAYATKASALLRTWFLDPATRMNPNLNYGQAVRGHNDGRGAGLIETRSIAEMIDAVGLLAGSKAWTPEDQSGIKDWVAKFLSWMQNSPVGKQEAGAKNNHGTYYDVQIVSMALFVGDTELAKRIVTEASEKRVAFQIEPDGRQPLELARTRSFSYSMMNLGGLFKLARLGENVGVDLWTLRTKDDRSIRKALDYLVPFAVGQSKWTDKQITAIRPADIAPLLVIAADKYDSPRYKELAVKLDADITGSLDSLLIGAHE
ncbi:MAG TPA: alginate lyase family protein [Clostridia bacterium]|nr:alginate lyase family protein [Clostridia bacterium]